MSTNNNPVHSIQKEADGEIETLKYKLEIPAAQQADFLRDPDNFLLNSLRASGQTTNKLIMGQSERTILTDAVKNSGGKVVIMTVIEAHVINPPKSRSHRIVIEALP
ncbi:hypothetical protein CR51_31235 [Caballeronia megalochromosomata]|nr:hypothetical protein CR51_31235 [Caballeronia megalochromosomata]